MDSAVVCDKAEEVQRLASTPPDDRRVLGRRYMVPAMALGLCVLVLVATQHLSKTLDYHSIIKTLRQMPPGLLVRSLAATALSYLSLIGRDAVALRYIGAKC